MLTISQVALRYGLSNRQVYDLISLGYLNIARVTKVNQGVRYWFSEQELDQLDIYSLVADAQARQLPRRAGRMHDWKQLSRTLSRYQRFLEDIEELPQACLLENSFYLFHLNHYAKTYPEESGSLYGLKKMVLKKMVGEYRDDFQINYLVGPDRNKVWLCEDCKDHARKAGIPYAEYARREYHCSKCYVQHLEKEYYSLIQFDLQLDQHRFSFHLPLSASRWVQDIHLLPQGIRETGNYSDRMFLYGRAVSRVEEQVYPLKMIIEGLQHYLAEDEDKDGWG
ncbi:MAG TPA: hypothetical protein VN426_14470 [Syntrophomonadaceae bacterium]|nr:hypothetical protein [Syntrophomonadaceae bacterium]